MKRSSNKAVTFFCLFALLAQTAPAQAVSFKFITERLPSFQGWSSDEISEWISSRVGSVSGMLSYMKPATLLNSLNNQRKDIAKQLARYASDPSLIAKEPGKASLLIGKIILVMAIIAALGFGASKLASGPPSGMKSIEEEESENPVPTQPYVPSQLMLIEKLKVEDIVVLKENKKLHKIEAINIGTQGIKLKPVPTGRPLIMNFDTFQKYFELP